MIDRVAQRMGTSTKIIRDYMGNSLIGKTPDRHSGVVGSKPTCPQLYNSLTGQYC